MLASVYTGDRGRKNKMGWKNKCSSKKYEKEGGLKIGFCNKGGALQPLQEKKNEIEFIVKRQTFLRQIQL